VVHSPHSRSSHDNYNRIIPVTTGRLPHSKTWDYFKSHLIVYFIHSPKIVKDVIITDINDLVQEFWDLKISSDGAVDVFFPPMGCLMRILKVCLDIIFIFPLTTLDFAV
jgi:hypothetical protein